jgi:hypothetical protein
MMHGYRTREGAEDLLRINSFPTAFPKVCRWAGRHAMGNLDLDGQRDEWQEIARTLERWVLVASHAASHAPGVVMQRGHFSVLEPINSCKAMR